MIFQSFIEKMDSCLPKKQYEDVALDPM